MAPFNLLPAEILNRIYKQLDSESQDALRHSCKLFFNKASNKLKKVEKLDLSYRKMDSIPEVIKHLRNVKKLNLEYNNIQNISVGNFCFLINLREMTIQHNKITAIPKEIGYLVNLSKLNLSFNKISSVSPAIGSLIKLTELKLQNNCIKELPPEIGKLFNLIFI
jgi:Leucine-rich repeat (LRR) protein